MQYLELLKTYIFFFKNRFFSSGITGRSENHLALYVTVTRDRFVQRSGRGQSGCGLVGLLGATEMVNPTLFQWKIEIPRGGSLESLESHRFRFTFRTFLGFSERQWGPILPAFLLERGFNSIFCRKILLKARTFSIFQLSLVIGIKICPLDRSPNR